MYKIRLNELAIAFVIFLIVMFVPANTEAKGGGNTWWAFTQYQGWYCGGSYGELLTTDPNVSASTGVANFIDIEFSNGDWLAIGWCEGVTPWGNTNGVRMFYYDRQVNGVYSGGLLGEVNVNTWHSYRMMYQLGTVFKWNAYIDASSKVSTYFAYRTGQPSANFEMHSGNDDLNGHVMNLCYGLISGRVVRFYPWDGYGAWRADPPLSQTFISNTEWICTCS